MNFRLTIRTLPNHTNCNWPIPSNILCSRYLHGIRLSHLYFTRRKLRLINPKYSCQRGITIFRMPLCTHWTRSILQIIPNSRNMIHWSNPTINYHLNSFSRVCITLRTNIILSSHRNYQSSFSHSLLRRKGSKMNLRRLFRKKRNINTFLRTTLPIPIFNCCSFSSSPSFSSRNWLKQSPRTKKK